jgi:hypothetical protein
METRMPTDETDRSLADELFEEAFGGDKVKLGGMPHITMGPLATHDPNEDPVAYNRRMRADYHRGLAAHGLRETGDGEVVEKDAAVKSVDDVTPETLVAISEEEEAEDKEASYQPAGMLVEQEGERPPLDLNNADKPAVSDFPPEAKRKTRNALLKKLDSKVKPTVVDAKKTETPSDVGQPGDTKTPPGSRNLPDGNPHWSPAATGATDKIAEDTDDVDRRIEETDQAINDYVASEQYAEDLKLSDEQLDAMRAGHDIEGYPAPSMIEQLHEEVVEKTAVEHTESGAFALGVVGLPPDAVGEWIREVAEAAGSKLDELTELTQESAHGYLDWGDPNPFLVSRVLKVMLGDEWIGWEPETVKTEIQRHEGTEDLALDRILAIKLMLKKPSIFFTNLRAAEKITVALSDTEVSPGDLEDLPPEWISLAVAVHTSLRPKGEKEPEYSGKVKALLAGNLIEQGIVLAPTLLMPIDELLKQQVSDEALRGEVLQRYVDSLVEGPVDVEDAVSIQVNRLLACHVAPLGVFADM